MFPFIYVGEWNTFYSYFSLAFDHPVFVSQDTAGISRAEHKGRVEWLSPWSEAPGEAHSGFTLQTRHAERMMCCFSGAAKQALSSKEIPLRDSEHFTGALVWLNSAAKFSQFAFADSRAEGLRLMLLFLAWSWVEPVWYCWLYCCKWRGNVALCSRDKTKWSKQVYLWPEDIAAWRRNWLALLQTLGLRHRLSLSELGSCIFRWSASVSRNAAI